MDKQEKGNKEKMLFRFGSLRLSSIKKCPHMLRSDDRKLKNWDHISYIIAEIIY